MGVKIHMTERRWLGNAEINHDMGTSGQQKGRATPAAEIKPPSQGGSEQRQLGRRLKVTFHGKTRPELHKVEFQFNAHCRAASLERGIDDRFKFTAFPQALSLLFLDYAYHAMTKRRDKFVFRGAQNGSMAATFCNAMYQEVGFIHDLFVELPLDNKSMTPCLDDLITGNNLGGKEKRDRCIQIKSDFLPADCVEIIWDAVGKEPLTENADVKRLKDQIRRSLELPIEMEPETEPQLPPEPGLPEEQRDGAKKKAKSGNEAIPQAEALKLSAWLSKEFQNALNTLKRASKEDREHRDSSPQPPKPAPAEEPPKHPADTENIKSPDETAAEAMTGREIRQSKIDLNLFREKESALFWPDDMPLIAWDEGDDSHVWKLKNAFEGVLIMGATGSGKTSGSGAAIAEAFLRSGFGGLIMTVKADEAERWRRLCAYCGREGDFIAIRRGGDWKLNIMDYAVQRPGQGAELSDNLTSFCLNLLQISSRSQGQQHSDQIWVTAGDQLLNATFDLFLLAGVSINFDRLADFVAAAPTDNPPTDETGWLKFPVFGNIYLKAKNSLATPEDKRIFGRATHYWFKVYAGLNSRTRTSVTLGIFALFDAFRGRDVPALISSDTNLTPESIMSGKIVVLDLPLEEVEHTGLLVQSSWKYLFQTALARHSRSGNPHKRPVFLWEDEAQRFFSEHDHQFQATARSSRVCHVVLSQNVHNFYKEFGQGGTEAANSFFANLNTKIFHANSSPVTNEWAARHFGQEIRHRVTISHNPSQPRPPSQDTFNSLMAAWNPPSTTGISTTEQWEYVVRPEEFNRLRIGGPENDFQVDAFITWIGTSSNKERHFTHITFNQNKNI